MPLTTLAPYNRPSAAIVVAGCTFLAAMVGVAFAGGRPLVRLDGLALAIVALTGFVGVATTAFSLRYMRADRRRAGLFLNTALLLASVVVLVIASNLLVLAVAWCASGWLMARLIGHCDGWSEATLAARRTTITFAIGDGAVIAAVGLLSWHAGSLDLDRVLERTADMPGAIPAAAALLLLIAAAARCALPPFSGWLLSSMTAPTPVSALMHAGFVNAGGFLLLRFAPVLEAAPAVRLATVALGGFAALYGIGVMLVRPDIKRSLAGSTVSQMGFMIMGCGLGAYAAALWHIVAHGLFKAWLFLGSGSTIGTRPSSSTKLDSAPITLGVAAAAFAGGSALLVTGNGFGELIPLTLAVATAMATLLASASSETSARAKATVAVSILALAGIHALGFGLANASVSSAAPPLLAPWALALLLSGFLAAWAWQRLHLARGGRLPGALYTHLLNAGALPCAAKGEAQ